MKITVNTMRVCALLCKQNHADEEEVQIPPVPTTDPGADAGTGPAAGDGGHARSGCTQ